MTINHQSALNHRCLYDKLYLCIIRNLDFKTNTGNKKMLQIAGKGKCLPVTLL